MEDPGPILQSGVYGEPGPLVVDSLDVRGGPPVAVGGPQDDGPGRNGRDGGKMLDFMVNGMPEEKRNVDQRIINIYYSTI